MLNKLQCANNMEYFSPCKRMDRARPGEAVLSENNNKQKIRYN